MIGQWNDDAAFLVVAPRAWSKGNGLAALIADDSVIPTFPNGNYQPIIMLNCIAGEGYQPLNGEGVIRLGGNNEQIRTQIGSPTIPIAGLDQVQEFTLEYWIKQNVVDNTDVFMRYQVDADNRIQISTNTTGNGQIQTVVETGGGNNNIVRNYVDDGYIAGQWMHLVIVFNGTAAAADRLKYYFNGVGYAPTITGTTPVITANFSTQPLWIFGMTSNSWDGDAAWVAFYSRQLGATEILNNYNLGPDMGGLVGTDDGAGSLALSVNSQLRPGSKYW